MKNKAVFLDRDGVLNVEIGDYIKNEEQLEITDIATELKALKSRAYLLIVATNQGGISKGFYERDWVFEIHNRMQQKFGALLDELYYAPEHPSKSRSYLAKPDKMMFEKGIAKFDLEPSQCWMIGDKERDLIPAKLLNMRCILLSNECQAETAAHYVCSSFSQATQIVLSNS